MNSPARLDLPTPHRRLVLDILRATLPAEATVWVFGSRATGRARRYSDLDLAIDAGRRLTFEETAILAESFSDSDLPYKVDMVDWHRADNHFKRLIAAERLPLDPTGDR